MIYFIFQQIYEQQLFLWAFVLDLSIEILKSLSYSSFKSLTISSVIARKILSTLYLVLVTNKLSNWIILSLILSFLFPITINLKSVSSAFAFCIQFFKLSKLIWDEISKTKIIPWEYL